MKKLWLRIKIFFTYLFLGMRQADNAMSVGEKTDSDGVSVTQKKEADNVYAQLLRGEVTQEVKELRHEMYYAERRSHDYIYSGGGRAKKLNDIFNYEGKIENSDGHRVQIVQDNRQDMASIEDYGIDIEKSGKDYNTIKMEDIASKSYIIKVLYPFLPKFKLDQFIKKVVVKYFEDDKRILDIYINKYPARFDRISTQFTNAIESVYMGDTRSEILDIESLAFVTKNAYGSDDLIKYVYGNFVFKDIIDFDGNYVLRFLCDVICDGEDLIQEFYDETAEQKSREHAPRENATINLDTANEIIERDSYDVDTAKELMEDLK